MTHYLSTRIAADMIPAVRSRHKWHLFCCLRDNGVKKSTITANGMNRMFFRSMKVWIAATVLVALVLAGTAIGVHVTSSTSFCLSCHEMRVHQQELALSPHAQDARGNAIECVQCHIPSTNIVRMLSAKTWLGTKDLWVHATTGGSVTLNRREIQPEARRFMDDANCRACHEDLYRNAKNDGAISEYGRLAHDNYLDKNGSSRSGCAGCHRNIAHLPPEDRHYDANAAFASKLTFKEVR